MPLFFDPLNLASESSIRRTQQLERDRQQIARTTRRIETLKQVERRLGEEFGGPVSSKYLYPSDRREVVAHFRARLEDEVENLINANVRKQAEPDIVGRNQRRILRMLYESQPEQRSRLSRDNKVRPRAGYKDVVNRFDASPRTVFGTDAWRYHMDQWGPRSSWKFSTRNFFRTGHLVVPCIQRSVRREVIHAKRKAHGHRVKHRPGRFSDVWC